MSDAPLGVAAVQAAAVDRALSDAAVARDHLALVGALEPACGDGDPLATAATALLAVRLLDADDAPRPLASARHDDPDLAVRGAAVAHRRFGVTAARAADLAGVPAEAVLAALD